MPSQKLVKVVRLWALLGLLLSQSACVASGVQLQEVNKAAMEIKEAVAAAIPVPIKYTSTSNREFISVPFVRYGKKLKPATNELQRAYAKVFIKGDRRPYTIEVIVPVEESVTPRSVQKNFQVIGYDDRIAKIILARLKAYLNKSPGEESNLVDDFKVF